MRLAATLLLASALTGWGQAAPVGVVLKPWAAADAKTLLGLKDHTVWTLSVTCSPGAASYYRQDATALLAVAELPAVAALDILDKAAKVDPRGLGSKAIGLLVKASGGILTGLGVATANPYAAAIGLSVTFADGAKDVLHGIAPQTLNYVSHLLPDNDAPIPCREGRGGEWIVISGMVAKPEVFTVPLIRPNAINEIAPNVNSEPTATPIPTRTVPMQPLVFSDLPVTTASGADLDIETAGCGLSAVVPNASVVNPGVSMVDTKLAFAPSASVTGVPAANAILVGNGTGTHMDVPCLIPAQAGKPLQGATHQRQYSINIHEIAALPVLNGRMLKILSLRAGL